jgi:hypothetical protein
MKFRLTQAARRQTNFRTIQWRRNCVGTSQDHDADGGVVLQNAARRAEGTDGGAIVYSLVRMVMCQSQPCSNTSLWSRSVFWMRCGGSARRAAAYL